jgi:serine/threonine protein kinase
MMDTKLQSNQPIRRRKMQDRISKHPLPYERVVAATAAAPAAAVSTSETDATTHTFWLQKDDLVDARYSVQRPLGKGVFGQVYQAMDLVKQRFVAIKCIRTEQRFAQQVEDEVRILKYIREHHIAGTVDLIGRCTFKGHACLIFELLHINLTEYLRKRQLARARHNQAAEGMSLWSISFIAKQLLSTLAQLSAQPSGKQIIHCDLKPDNIALQNRESFDVKLLDFGSACSREQRKWMYVQSRSYRAPEVILRIGYRESIDMWSLGATLMQLYTGTPLFPAETEYSLLKKQIATLGMPPSHIIEASPKRDLYFERKSAETREWEFKTSTPTNADASARKTIAHIVAPSNRHAERFASLILRMLEWDPNTRITPAEALTHVFFRV